MKFKITSISLLTLPFLANATVVCYDRAQNWLGISVGWPVRLILEIYYAVQGRTYSFIIEPDSEYIFFEIGLIINLVIFYFIGKLFKLNRFLLPALYLAVIIILGLLWLSGITCTF